MTKLRVEHYKGTQYRMYNIDRVFVGSVMFTISGCYKWFPMSCGLDESELEEALAFLRFKNKEHREYIMSISRHHSVKEQQ